MAYDIKVTELTEESPISEQPDGINITLKRHQLTLLRRCVQYENEALSLEQFPLLSPTHSIDDSDYVRTRIGILGDHVGSGKSYVILSIIMTNNDIHNGPSLRSYGCNQVLLCMHDRTQTLKTSLLVIPHNLCCQWETYVNTFSDRIKYCMINKSRLLFPFMNENIEDYDLIIVTGTFYNRVASHVASKNYKLRRVIFDEVDDINIPSCSSINSDFYWFVTASYGNLIWPKGYSKWDTEALRCVLHATGIKNSGFIKTMFTDLSANIEKDIIKILVIRNSPEYVQNSMILPEIHNHYIKCKTPVAINILHGLVNRHIIDALNAGDISSAMQYVNPNNRTSEDNIIHALIDKFAMQLRNLEIHIMAMESMEFESETQRITEIYRLTSRKEDLQKKIESIKCRIHSTDTCCICYDLMQNKCVVPCCSNSYCFECISRWLTSGRTPTCPICKHTPLTMTDLLVVQNDTSAPAIQPCLPVLGEISIHNDKIQNLESILLNRRQGAKTLIFSSYDNTFSNIIPLLNRMRIRHASLRGNHMMIRNTMNEYRNGNLDVLLVNAHQYGSGLNLENTTDLIMFHHFQTELEKQVIGRAQRYGRNDSLNVWYLLYENEMHYVPGENPEDSTPIVDTSLQIQGL
jgi:SNF2 family DNA or RNA helicase